MTLGEKQRYLCSVLPQIEIAMLRRGYQLVREDARRAESLHGNFGVKRGYAAAYSVHKLKLAQDYSVFDSDGNYLRGEDADKAFNIMHDEADKFGLAERIEGDLGHFSMEHQGHR